MKAPKISEDEQKQLRDRTKSELLRLEKYLSNAEATKVVDEFKNKFNICETLYKIVLAKHQECKGKEVDTYLKVYMTQVPYALAFAGYSFDRNLLNELFGSSSASGTTIKKLRDAITHGISERAVKEILSRREESFGYMDTFLNTIRNFDSAA